MEQHQTKKLTLILDEEGIFCQDHSDYYNLESFYTRGGRKATIIKAFKDMKSILADDTTLSQLFNIADGYKLKPHRYCAMD